MNSSFKTEVSGTATFTPETQPARTAHVQETTASGRSHAGLKSAPLSDDSDIAAGDSSGGSGDDNDDLDLYTILQHRSSPGSVLHATNMSTPQRLYDDHEGVRQSTTPTLLPSSIERSASDGCSNTIGNQRDKPHVPKLQLSSSNPFDAPVAAPKCSTNPFDVDASMLESMTLETKMKSQKPRVSSSGRVPVQQSTSIQPTEFDNVFTQPVLSAPSDHVGSARPHHQEAAHHHTEGIWMTNFA